jgi:hypothetical protein
MCHIAAASGPTGSAHGAPPGVDNPHRKSRLAVNLAV